MARLKRYKLKDFPVPGSVFSMPLADGRLGICRVLRVQTDRKGEPQALVAASDWIGHIPPAINDPGLRRTLVLTHHSWVREPQRLWISEPPPATYIKLGTIKLSREDETVECNSYSGWESHAIQVLAQWRWDHDRAAVLREDAREKAARDKIDAQAAFDRKRHLSRVTLSEIAERSLFPSWTDYTPKRDTRDLEKIIKNFIRNLSKPAKPLERKFVADQLKVVVQKINELDSERQFIETVEREDLFDLFEEILHAGKHPDLLDIVDETRDW